MISDDASEDAAMETQDDTVMTTTAATDNAGETVTSENALPTHDTSTTSADTSIHNENTSANENSGNLEFSGKLEDGDEFPLQSSSRDGENPDDALRSRTASSECQVDNDCVDVPPPEQGNSEMAAPIGSDGGGSDGSVKSSSAASSKSSLVAGNHRAGNSPEDAVSGDEHDDGDEDDDVLMGNGDKNTAATTTAAPTARQEEKRSEPQPKKGTHPVAAQSKKTEDYSNDQKGAPPASAGGDDSSDGEQSSVEYDNEPDSKINESRQNKTKTASGDQNRKSEHPPTNSDVSRDRGQTHSREHRGSSGKVQHDKHSTVPIRKSPRNHDARKSATGGRSEASRQKNDVSTPKRSYKNASVHQSSSGTDRSEDASSSSSVGSSGSGGRPRSPDNAQQRVDDGGNKRRKTLSGSKTVKRDGRGSNRDSRKHSSGSNRKHSSNRGSPRRSHSRSKSYKSPRDGRGYEDDRRRSPRGYRDESSQSSSSEEYSYDDEYDKNTRKGRKRGYNSRGAISRSSAASRRGKMYDRRSSRLRPPSPPTVLNRKGGDGRRKQRRDRDVSPESPATNRSRGSHRTSPGTANWKAATIRAHDERRSKSEADKIERHNELDDQGNNSGKSSAAESDSSTKSGSSDDESSEEPLIFEEVVVHFASGRTLQENKPVSDALLHNGGTILLRLTPRVNFLVAVTSDKKDCRVKLRRGLQQKNTFVVRPRLFLAAIDEGSLTDELIQKYSLPVDLQELTDDDDRVRGATQSPHSRSSKKSTPSRSTQSNKRKPSTSKRSSPSERRGPKSSARDSEHSDVEMDEGRVAALGGSRSTKQGPPDGGSRPNKNREPADDARSKSKSGSDALRRADQFKTLDFTSEDCVFKTLLIEPTSGSKTTAKECLMEVVELPECPEQSFAVRVTRGADVLGRRKEGGPTRVQKEIISESASIKAVLKCFKEKFEELTGNEWMRTQSNTSIFFVEIPEMFTLSPLWSEPTPNAEDAETAEKFGPIREVVTRLCDSRQLTIEMENMGIDTARLSCDKLTSSLVDAALTALGDVSRELLKNGGASSQRSATAGEAFFRTLSYNQTGGGSKGITDVAVLSSYVEHVLSLRHIILCRDLIKSSEAAVARHAASNAAHSQKRDFISCCFKRIGAELSYVMPKDPVYSIVQTYMLNTNAGAAVLSLRSLFEVVRHEEDLIFEDYQSNAQRKLLWYGARTASFPSLLLQGVKEPPSNAPLNHSTFGRGLCFYDVVSEALEDCHIKPGASSAWLLLCEVALGDHQRVKERNPLGHTFSLTKDHMSAVALGRVQPDPAGTVKLEDDDITVPSGKLIPFNPSSPFKSNTYVVFDDAQICTRFLVQVGLETT